MSLNSEAQSDLSVNIQFSTAQTSDNKKRQRCHVIGLKTPSYNKGSLLNVLNLQNKSFELRG